MATEKTINIIVKKDKADKSVKELKNEVKEVDKSTNKLTDSLDKMSGGAVSGFKKLKSGLTSAITGFRSLRVAIAATGIGLLITGILAVKQALTSSEEGQNKFQKFLTIIGSIIGNLSDVLSNVGMKIISVFENPKQALSDFGSLLKRQIVNRLVGLLEFIPKLGKAFKQLWSGDFSDAAKTATDAVGKIAFGVESITDETIKATNAFKEFTKEVVKDAEIAGKIADKRAKADKVERNLLVARAKANREIAELRFKAEQRDKFSAEERIKFLKDASNLEEDITKKEIFAAKLRLQAKQSENALANSTKEDLDEEAQLKAKVIDLETKRLNLSKLLESKIQSTQKEATAAAEAERKAAQDKLDEEEKLRIEKAEKEAKNELERLEKIAEIQDEFKKRREDEAAETELQKLQLEKERELQKLDDLRATEEQKANIIKFYNDKIAEQKKIDAANEISLEEQVANAKESIANRTASLLIALGGKAAKVGKAIAIAQTIRSGIEGTQAAYTTAQKSPITVAFPAYPIVQAGLAAGFAALKVKQIASTPDVGGTASVSSSSSSSQTTSAPSFNLVQGTPTNQIAESISDLNKNPVKAIVVASDVTTAQQANRNKIEESSI